MHAERRQRREESVELPACLRAEVRGEAWINGGRGRPALNCHDASVIVPLSSRDFHGLVERARVHADFGGALWRRRRTWRRDMTEENDARSLRAALITRELRTLPPQHQAQPPSQLALATAWLLHPQGYRVASTVNVCALAGGGPPPCASFRSPSMATATPPDEYDGGGAGGGRLGMAIYRWRRLLDPNN